MLYQLSYIHHPLTLGAARGEASEWRAWRESNPRPTD